VSRTHSYSSPRATLDTLGIILMPCKKYKSKKQRGLCFATNEWKDFSKLKKKKMRRLI
jgi:hypothetical protein